MRKIKKYANRKLYDTIEKKYISLDELAELVRQGEEVSVEDNETGEDITVSTISQILAREKTANKDEMTSGILIDLIRKGSGTVIGYAKKYNQLCYNALTMAEDEADKLVALLIKNKEISESEGGRLKKELKVYAESFRKWVGDKVDQRVAEVLDKMNLASKEQVISLADRIEALNRKLENLEKLQAETKGEMSEKQE
jgi:polyhydroxyalkanoate synthesis repressor PhaR